MNFQNNNNITKEQGEYDYSIAITRIVGCIMIFLCHYVQITGNPIIAQSSQFFNVGVFVFFFDIRIFVWAEKYRAGECSEVVRKAAGKNSRSVICGYDNYISGVIH